MKGIQKLTREEMENLILTSFAGISPKALADVVSNNRCCIKNCNVNDVIIRDLPNISELDNVSIESMIFLQVLYSQLPYMDGWILHSLVRMAHELKIIESPPGLKISPALLKDSPRIYTNDDGTYTIVDHEQLVDGIVERAMKDVRKESLDELKNMKEEDLLDCHFGLAMGIRNQYIHPDEFRGDPDRVSNEVVEAMWKKLQEV